MFVLNPLPFAFVTDETPYVSWLLDEGKENNTHSKSTRHKSGFVPSDRLTLKTGSLKKAKLAPRRNTYFSTLYDVRVRLQVFFIIRIK